jgi:hypothetical protein
MQLWALYNEFAVRMFAVLLTTGMRILVTRCGRASAALAGSPR